MLLINKNITAIMFLLICPFLITMLSRQEEKRKATREAILLSAIQLMVDDGYSACSIASIAKNNPFSAGAIQYHFRSKDDLLFAVITEHIFGAPNLPQLNIDLGLPLQVRCKQVVDVMWQYYGHQHYPIVWEILLGVRHNAPLLEQINSFYGNAELDAEKQAMKVFSDLSLSPKDAKELTQFVSSHLRGVSLIRRTSPTGSDVSTQLDYLVGILLLKMQAYVKTNQATKR